MILDFAFVPDPGAEARIALDGTVALADRVRSGEGEGVNPHASANTNTDACSFAGYRFPPEAIVLAVRWYLRYSLSYREAEELLAERGVEVDHVTVFRWVQRFTPLLIEAATPCRHGDGDRWFVDDDRPCRTAAPCGRRGDP